MSRFLIVAALVFGALLAPVSARSRSKSPSAAFGLSLFPGALVHGAGHRYAGDRKKASLLLLSEIFGLALMNLDHPREGVDQQIGNRTRSGIDNSDLQSLGQVLFFGGWLYDMAASGDAVRRANRRTRTQGFELGFEPAPERGRASFNPRAKYTVTF